jgi:hypothetical protein
MTTRVIKVIRGFGVVVGTSAVTWMLSWFIQYVCSLTIAGSAFRLGSQPANRLAAITVVAAFAVAVLILFIVDANGFLLFIMWVAFASSAIAGIAWLSNHVFVGTTVSTPAAHVIYSILVGIWGIALFYTFLSDLTDTPEKPAGK